MLELVLKKRCKREIELAKRRGKKLDKLWVLVELLLEQSPLPPRYRNHKLVGDWVGYWECHIEPDWLLVYKVDGADLILAATGTHSDLFE